MNKIKIILFHMAALALLGSTSLYAAGTSTNKLSTYKKSDGTYMMYTDGSGKIYFGCKENNCSEITGKYSHPHNIQQHKKTFITLNANGTGDYELWSYKGDELFCKGKITKWGLLYKNKKLASSKYIFLASKGATKHSECAFKDETIIYTDFRSNAKSASFKYFLKSN
jgi:hypothetical protein